MQMQWLRLHPYTIATIVAGVVILFGALIVSNRSAVSPADGSIQAWGGLGGLSNPIADQIASEKAQEDIYSNVRNGAPFFYAPSQTQSEDAGGGADDFNLSALLATLARPAPPTQASGETAINAYSFIPGGLISTTSVAKTRTKLQDALYTYGNDAGSIIQTFEEAHPNMPQVLKDQFEDKGDATKRGRLLELARSLEDVGFQLEAIEPIPGEIKAPAQKLAESYKEIGKKLALIPGAERDADILNAMLTYNAAAEAFVKNYVALATVFSLNDVRFRPDEPGSTFTFSVSSF